MASNPLATCEPITQAMRYHYDLPANATWRVSTLKRTKMAGTRVVTRFLSDRLAAAFCRRHGLTFPPVGPVLDPAPVSCAHDPDHGVAMVDGKALAAGDPS